MIDIHDKRILITGASSGIGKSTAILLSSHGAHLILVSRNIKKLKAVAQESQSTHPMHLQPVVWKCDVSDYDQVKMMIAACWNLAGRIDILINNAGVGVYGDHTFHSIQDYKDVMDVNFYGAIYCMMEIIPFMKRQRKGQIINVASIAALHGIPFLSAYCASKAALVSLSQSLRAELSNTPIEIKIVYPGYTKTEFFKNEKNAGDLKRPGGHYDSPQKVSKSILNIIGQSRQDKVLSFDGLKIKILSQFVPKLLDRILANYAIRLKKIA